VEITDIVREETISKGLLPGASKETQNLLAYYNLNSVNIAREEMDTFGRTGPQGNREGSSAHLYRKRHASWIRIEGLKMAPSSSKFSTD
jgi:hypothetical protein